jgi:hypothetical protein
MRVLYPTGRRMSRVGSWFFCFFNVRKPLSTQDLGGFAPAPKNFCKHKMRKTGGGSVGFACHLLPPPNPQALALRDVSVQAYRDGLTVNHRRRGDVATA